MGLYENGEAKPWHNYLHEFRGALKRDDQEAFERAVEDALAGDHIIREDGLLIDGNEYGRSYNCMGQSTMGLALIRSGRKWGIDEWLDDGIDAMNVLLTPYDEGGLRLRDGDSETAWYVGKTSRDHDTKGGTLNKHLYATRTLFEAAKEMEALGNMQLAAQYEEAGEEGFLKLVKGHQGPQLKDYFVKTNQGDAYFESWVYYSCGNADGDRPYFLKVPEKNGGYHIYDMNLIYRLGNLVDEDFNFRPFYKEQLGSISAFGGMLQVYENKLDAGGLDVDTATSFGQFSATINGIDDTLDSTVVDWFEDFLRGPRILGTDGDDVLAGSNLDEILRGRNGDDDLSGASGSDTLRGGKGNDTLRGGAGADKLVSGFGTDKLKGGKGDDIFRFANKDVSKPGEKRDTIADFEPGRDVVDLRGIDVDPDEKGNQAFIFIAGNGFSGTPGELRFSKEILEADLDGDGLADLEIAMPGVSDLSAADILL